MIGLEFICRQKNIQYKDLAEELGIGKQSITNWVMGRRNIPGKHLEKLSEMLKIAPEWLQKELSNEDQVVLLGILNNNSKIDVNIQKSIDRFKKELVENIEYYLSDILKDDTKATEIMVDFSCSMVHLLLETLKNQNVNINTVFDVMIALNTADNEKSYIKNRNKFTKIIRMMIEEENIRAINSFEKDELINKYIYLNEQDYQLLKEFELDDAEKEIQIIELFNLKDDLNDSNQKYKVEQLIFKLRNLINIED